MVKPATKLRHIQYTTPPEAMISPGGSGRDLWGRILVNGAAGRSGTVARVLIPGVEIVCLKEWYGGAGTDSITQYFDDSPYRNHHKKRDKSPPDALSPLFSLFRGRRDHELKHSPEEKEECHGKDERDNRGNNHTLEPDENIKRRLELNHIACGEKT